MTSTLIAAVTLEPWSWSKIFTLGSNFFCFLFGIHTKAGYPNTQTSNRVLSSMVSLERCLYGVWMQGGCNSLVSCNVLRKYEVRPTGWFPYALTLTLCLYLHWAGLFSPLSHVPLTCLFPLIGLHSLSSKYTCHPHPFSLLGAGASISRARDHLWRDHPPREARDHAQKSQGSYQISHLLLPIMDVDCCTGRLYPKDTS